MSDQRINQIEALGEEFMRRLKAGEKISIAGFVANYPDHSDELQGFLQALQVVDRFKPDSLETECVGPNSIPEQIELPEIADYRIIREIGRGGMGIVYEAEQVSLGRHVALKVLPRERNGDEIAVKRFLREARSAASLFHTNIVGVFEVHTSSDLHYYAMQFIEGTPLNDVIAEVKRLRSSRDDSQHLTVEDTTNATTKAGTDSGNLSFQMQSGGGQFDTAKATGKTKPGTGNQAAAISESLAFGNDSAQVSDSGNHKYYRDVARIGIQVANALQYAHTQGVIHRDVKPANLLLDNSGNVWLADFGLVKTEEDGLTRAGDIVGTLRYMSPERFKGQCDKHADIYSLGITLYEMLALQPAFSAINRPSLIESIRTQQPRRLRIIEKRIPADLETIIFKAIAGDPSRRYQSAVDLAADLENFIEQRPINARRVGPLERLSLWARKRKALAASLAVVATLLVLGLIGSAAAANHFFVKEKEQAQLTRANSALAQKRTEERDRATSLAYLADLRIGGDQLRAGRFDELFQVLKRYVPETGQPDIRKWEWYFLLGELFRADRTILFEESGNGRIHWTGNDQVLGICSRSLEIMDGQSGQRLQSIEVNELFDFSFSSDGRRVVTVGHEPVKIWSVDDGRLLKTLDLGASTYTSVNWFDQNRQLAVGIPGRGETVLFVDVGSGEITDKLTATGPAYDLAVSPNQKQLLVGVLNACRVYDMETHELIREHVLRTDSLAWSPDGKFYAFNSKLRESEKNSVHIFRSLDGEPVREIQNSDPIESFSWGADSRTMLLGTTNQQVILQDIESLEVIEVLGGHHHSVSSCQWNANSKTSFATYSQNVLKIWSLDEQEDARSNPSTLSSDGRHVATRRIDKVVVSDAATGKEVLSLPMEKGPVLGIDWVTDRSCLVVRDQQLLRSYDIPSGQMIGEIPMNYDVVESTSDHRYWGIGSKANMLSVIGDNDDQMMIWDATTGKPLRIWIPHSHAVRSASFSPDGSRLATVGNADTRVWDVASGKELFVVYKTYPRGSGDFRIVRPDWSSDSQTLITHDYDFSGKIWDGATGALKHTLRGHNNYLSDIAMAAQGTRVVTIDNDHRVIVWDTESGQQVIELPTRGFAGTTVTWDEDSKSIVVNADDGSSIRFSAVRGQNVANTDSFITDFESLQKQLGDSKDVGLRESDSYNLSNRLLRDPGVATAQAERALQLAQRTFGDRVPDDRNRGMAVIALIRTGQWNKAIEEVDDLLKKNPGRTTMIGFFSAIAHWKNGDKQKALDQYLAIELYQEQNNEQGVNSPFSSREEADELMGPELLDYYRSNLAASPGDIDWLVRVGLLESRLDRFDDSVLRLEEAIRIEPTHAFATRLLVRVLGERAKQRTLGGDRDAAAADWNRATELCENELKEVSPNQIPRGATTMAGFLADIKFAKLRKWIPVVPDVATSSMGARFTRLEDDSFLATGPNFKQEVYEYQFRVGDANSNRQAPRSIQMEFLPHESMPSALSARTWNGQGAISQIEVLRVDDSGTRTPLAVIDSFSPHEFVDPEAGYCHRINDALDQDPNTFWRDSNPKSITPISFLLDEYPGNETDSLIVRLHFPQEGIGRIRFSFSDNDNAVAVDRMAELSQTFRTDPWMSLVTAHLLLGEADAARVRFELVRKLNTSPMKDRDRLFRSWVLHQLGETADTIQSVLEFRSKNLAGAGGHYPDLLVQILTDLDTSGLAPDEASALNKIRAHCLQFLGRSEEAIGDLKKAVELMGTGDLCVKLSNLLEETGDPKGALENIDRAIELGPDNPAWLILKGLLLLEADRQEEYSAWLEKIPEAQSDATFDSRRLVAKLLRLPKPEDSPAARLPPDPLSNADAGPGELRWSRIARSLLDIHRIDYQAAIDDLQPLAEIDNPNGNQRPYVVVALAIRMMALSQLNQTDALRETQERYQFFANELEHDALATRDQSSRAYLRLARLILKSIPDLAE